MYNLCGRTVQFRRFDCSIWAVALFNSKRSGCSTWTEYSIVERTDNHTAFVIIKCKMKCSFHNLSSFDYIVTKEFILYECADLDIGKDTNLSIDVLIPPVQCHEFIKVYCTSLLTWGNLFAKYYLSEYFRAFYKGKIILLTFPHSSSTDLAEFD